MSKADQRLARELFYKIEVEGETVEDTAKECKLTHKRTMNVLARHPNERKNILDGFKGQIRKRIDSKQIDLEDYLEDGRS